MDSTRTPGSPAAALRTGGHQHTPHVAELIGDHRVAFARIVLLYS
ncbi:hypothetical protein [Streptomyces sp. NPDC059943]